MNVNSLKEAVRCVDRIQRELKIPCLLIGGFAVNEYGYIFSKPDDALRLDFLTADETTLSRLEANAASRTLHGVSFHIPSLRDLLAMKIFALKSNFERRKSKDLPDIAYLTILNHLDYKKDILPLCERYGNPDIAEKIQIELRNLQS